MVLKMKKTTKEKPKKEPTDELVLENTQGDNSSGRSTDPLKYAFSFDGIYLLDAEAAAFQEVELHRDAYPDAAPYILDKRKMKLGEQIKGYIVHGVDYFPQFIPEAELERFLSVCKRINSTKPRELKQSTNHDEGILVYLYNDRVVFYPKSIYKYGEKGIPYSLFGEEKATFKAPVMWVHLGWVKGRDIARARRNRQNKEQAKKAALAAAALPGAGAVLGAAAAGAKAGAGAAEAGAAAGAAEAEAGVGAAGVGAVHEGRDIARAAGNERNKKRKMEDEEQAGAGAAHKRSKMEDKEKAREDDPTAVAVLGAGAVLGGGAEGAKAGAGAAEAGAAAGAGETGVGAAGVGVGIGAAGVGAVHEAIDAAPGAVAGGGGAGAGGEAAATGAGAADEIKVDDTKKDKLHTETVWWKKTWFLCIIIPILCVVGLVVLGGTIYGILLAFGVKLWNSEPSPTESVSQSTGALSNHVHGSGSGGSGGSGGGNPQTTSSTTPTTTTTTRAYPAMTAIQRIPVKNLMKPTFDIVSSILQISIRSIHPISYVSTVVTFVLKITSITDTIQLYSDVLEITSIYMDNVNGTPIGWITDIAGNATTQLLTMKTPKPIHEGTVSVKITFGPANKAFEEMGFPCGKNNCSVYVNRKLSVLVPHFDKSTKHKWSIEVKLPVGATVVTNTKAKSASTSRSTTFLETAPILPYELSIIIVENFVKQASGTQIEYYLPSGTLAKEATRMIRTLGNGLATKTKPTIPKGEMFFFIVIPAMENYQFYGRNVALLGTSLLRSNTEIQQDFVWNFIFRTVIYDKVTPADKKSSWVYEQSALFLSTSIKSTNKNLWKKHYYEIVMNNGRDDMKALVNQSIVYEDERRYLEKRHHVAKVSTILAMFVSVNNDTSTDPLTVLDTVRSNETSSQFFFIKSQLKIGNGAPVDVDRVISCYVDTPVTPRLHINRTSPTHVAIRRSSGGPTDGCDMLLWLEKGQKMGTTVNKEHKVLSGTVEKVEVESNSPVLLSGETPFSAYGYTMEQSEFDRLLDVSVVNSYDESSLKMLAFNAFDAAAEGILSYESVKTFIKLLVSQKVLTVDETVDLWMEPVIQSRNVEMMNLTERIVASVLNTTVDESTAVAIGDHVAARFDKAVQISLFEIEKAAKLVKGCGKNCYSSIVYKYGRSLECVIDGGDTGCSYNPHILEMYVCAAESKGNTADKRFDDLHDKCIGKTCQLSTLRGIMCSTDITKLQGWLSNITTMDTTDMINKQIVLTVFKGLVFNEVSRPMMSSHFLENWHQMHQQYSNSPALLGEIIEILSSTMYTSEELTQFHQFVAFYEDNLAMYKEFEEQAEKAKKVVEWNEKYSKNFIQIFS